MSRIFERNRSLPALVRRFPTPAQVAAISAALPLCEPAHAPEVATRLIELAIAPPVGSWPRGRARRAHADLALTEVVRQWNCIPEDLRAVALGVGRGRWVQAVESLLTSPHAHDRQNVALLARDARDQALAPALCTLLTDPDPTVLRLVDEAMAVWARDHIASDAVDEAVAHALRTYPVHRSAALIEVAVARLNAAVLAGPPSPLKEWFVADHADLTPLQAALRRGKGAVIRLRAFEWLTNPRVRAAAIDRLARASGPEDHEAVLSVSFLAERPTRAAGLSLLFPAPKPGMSVALPSLPDRAQFERLSVAARRGLARFVSIGRCPFTWSLRALEPSLTDADPLVRLSAAHAAPIRLLHDFCFDPDPAVGASATLRLSDRPTTLGEGERATLDRLKRSPHARVREIAALSAPGELEDTPLSRARWRLRLNKDRSEALGALRTVLRSGDVSDRSAAVRLIRTLNLIDLFEGELVQLCEPRLGPAMSHAASAAVTALGSIGTTQSQEALLRAVEHQDERVRANAAEAIGVRTLRREFPTQEAVPALLELKRASHHRVSSSSLRALADAGLDPEAPAAVCRLMRDPEPVRRAAGAWAASRLLAEPKILGAAWFEVARGLRERAQDPEPGVSRRAALALARIGVTTEEVE
jgi:HEAT repeat protein